jgi:hypothetical protein
VRQTAAGRNRLTVAARQQRSCCLSKYHHRHHHGPRAAPWPAWPCRRLRGACRGSCCRRRRRRRHRHRGRRCGRRHRHRPNGRRRCPSPRYLLLRAADASGMHWLGAAPAGLCAGSAGAAHWCCCRRCQCYPCQAAAGWTPAAAAGPRGAHGVRGASAGGQRLRARDSRSRPSRGTGSHSCCSRWAPRVAPPCAATAATMATRRTELRERRERRAGQKVRWSKKRGCCCHCLLLGAGQLVALASCWPSGRGWMPRTLRCALLGPHHGGCSRQGGGVCALVGALLASCSAAQCC